MMMKKKNGISLMLRMENEEKNEDLRKTGLENERRKYRKTIMKNP